MGESLFADAALPQLQHCGEIEVPRGEVFYKALHNHPGRIEILLLCRGTGSYGIGGETHRVQARSLIVYNDGVWHEERSSGAEEHHLLFVRFSDLALRGLPPGVFLPPADSPVIALGDAYYRVERRFREIVDNRGRSTPESERIGDCLLAALLAELTDVIHHKSAPARNAGSSQIVETVNAYIQENYVHPITLRDLSEAAYMSPYYLCRRYKQDSGMTPFQYLIRYRIEVAMYYLRHTRETVQEIATRVGYGSDTHFQSLFRKVVGVTPGQYRSAAGKL